MKVVTDNSAEKIEIKDSGESIAIIHRHKYDSNVPPIHATILNEREALEIADYIYEKYGVTPFRIAIPEPLPFEPEE